MQTKHRKIGSFLGTTLPKDILEQLGLQEGDILNITVTAQGITLSPFDPDFEAFLVAAVFSEEKFIN